MNWVPDEDNFWQSWLDNDGQVGGFYTRYLTSDQSETAIHFITVRSAGHMVPTTQPMRALMVLNKFLTEMK